MNLWSGKLTDFTVPQSICSDRRTGVLALICELMDMNIYELIKGMCTLG